MVRPAARISSMHGRALRRLCVLQFILVPRAILVLLPSLVPRGVSLREDRLQEVR